MTTFHIKPGKSINKAAEYFQKLSKELDIGKYKLDKYQDLFMLSSFQEMHDADLAYDYIYHKCAEHSASKEALLHCLELEERLPGSNRDCLNEAIYRQHILKAIREIRNQLAGGHLDFLYA